MSDAWKKDFAKWGEEFSLISKASFEKFPKEFRKMLTTFRKGFLKEQCRKANSKVAITAPLSYEHKVDSEPAKTDFTIVSGSPIESVLSLMKTATQKVDSAKLLGHLASIYRLATMQGYETDPSDDEILDSAPIVDFSTLPKKHLQFLVKFLSTEASDTVERKDSIQLYSTLLKYVPCEPYNYLSDTVNNHSSTTNATHCSSCQKQSSMFQICIHCGMSTCDSCPLHSIALYGYGNRGDVQICQQCLDRFYNIHAAKWMNKAFSFIQNAGLQDLKAAFGCIQIALSLFPNINLKPVVRQLIEHDLPELALPVALIAKHESHKAIDKIKTSRLLSSALQSLANKHQNRELRQFLLTAAKEACSNSKFIATQLDSSSADTHCLQTDMDELNERIRFEQKCCIEEKRQAIEKFWATRNVTGLINFVKLSSKCHQSEFEVTLKALEQFLQPKVVSISSIVVEDRYALIFFQGVLKIYRQQYVEGMSDIEQVVWSTNFPTADILKQEAIQILLSLTRTDPSIFTLEGLVKVLQDNQHTLLAQPSAYAKCCSSRESQLLLLDDQEITPPFQENWPELSVDNLSVRAHDHEEKFEKNLQEKKWSYRDMGFAYVDYVHNCEHLIERGIALLHASMWFLKDLKSSHMQIDPSEMYALKKLILHCLHLAHMVARKSFHPGMQLHIGRIALAVALETLQLSKKVALPEDTDLFSYLLHMVTYNSRFVPFWKTPSVPVSEAFLLNVSSGQIHSQYLDNLLHRVQEDRPMSEAELRYQIYENAINRVTSIENPEQTHVTAMDELLSEKKWSVSDVEQLMTSPLSPRDEEGWLIQQSKLGAELEFADVKGMVLHLDFDKPSIELVVVPADSSHGKCGTFSLEDFRQVVSMVLDKDPSIGGLFFSLEQPDGQKRFHPFQEFLYSSETLHETDLLHTMFETDYLMKSFSIGTEVSSKPPFKQRLNKDGLTKNLPMYIQDKIKPVSDRGVTVDPKAHRFWIQADSIKYNKTSTGPKLEIRLGEMDMVVRSHPLIPDKHGKLIDTKEGDDPNSPEAQFAKDMTLWYDKIGKHFPMFLRLKQLAKLQVLGLLLQKILKRESEIISLYSEQYVALLSFLETIRLPIRPMASNPCKWVPAALRREKYGDDRFSLCYGGVKIMPKLVDGIVPNFPSNCKFLPITTLSISASKRGNSSNASVSGSQPTKVFKRSVHTSASTVEGPFNQSWAFCENRPQLPASELASEVFKFFAIEDTGDGSSGESDSGSGDSGSCDDENSSDSNAYAGYAAIAALSGVIALCMSCISQIANFFGDKRMKAENALQEMRTNVEFNPHCTKAKCITCSLKRISSVISFEVANGMTYLTTQISMTVKNAIYLIRCKITGKIYIGMTTREGVVRIGEHLSDIHNQRDKTVARHFNNLGCNHYGQFDEFMEISIIGYIKEETLKPYGKWQRKRIMELVEGKLMSLFPKEKLLNIIKNPCKSLAGLGISLIEKELIDIEFGKDIIVDGSLLIQFKDDVTSS